MGTINRITVARDGTPIDPSVVSEHRLVVRSTLCPLSSDPDAYNMLSSIDFTILNRIFRQLASRCNVDVQSMNQFTLEDFFVFTDQPNSQLMHIRGALGQFDSAANAILVNFQAIKRSKLSDRAKQLMLLHVIVHEFVHGIGCMTLWGSCYQSKIYEIVSRHGLAFKKPDLQFYKGLDEGLTELMSKSLVDQYLEETGVMKTAEAEELRKSIPPMSMREAFQLILGALKSLCKGALLPDLSAYEFPKSYVEEVDLVQKLIKALSKVTGVSESVVLEAFIREKIEGTTHHHNWDALFVDLMGKEAGLSFLETIAQMDPSVESSKLALGEEIKKVLYS